MSVADNAENLRLLVIYGQNVVRLEHLEQIARGANIDPVSLGSAQDLILVEEGDEPILLVETGIETLSIARTMRPNSMIFYCSGRADQEFAVECFRAGADDFLSRSAGDAALLQRISQAMERECAAPERAWDTDGPSSSRLIGDSPELRSIRKYIRKLAHSDVTTLIAGPTGSGKEVVALDLHEHSQRSSQPLIALNCAAIPDDLIEGELFGYEKGAYTGATQSYPGKLKLADGGTLFLDEIGELSLVGQAKLLRAIETGEIFRLGARRPTRVDIRIIAATNRDLFAEVQAGRFREDLYYRIAVAQIALSPLADRRVDIAPLADHFIRQICAKNGQPVPLVSSEIQSALSAHDWPGNARELRNIVELLLIGVSDGRVTTAHLPPHFRRPPDARAGQESQPDDTSILLEVLADCGGNKSEAAKRLNCSRMTLYRRLQRIDPETECVATPATL